MNTKADNNKSRNVAPKDLLQTAFVVAAGIILVWYRETGSKTAALIFALVPVVGVLYYLRIPLQERRNAELRAKDELRQNKAGKLFAGFLALLILAAIGLLIHSFVIT